MWAKTWAERRSAEVRHHSADTDISQVRRWILPTIGHVRLEQFTPAHVRAVSLAITGAGRSTSTGLRAQVVLKKMLHDAIQEGYNVPPRVDERGGPLAGRRDELHEIRHTTATLLMEDGVTDTVITAIMGHSSIVSSQAHLHASQAQATKALSEVALWLHLT